jgi:hypothetical protein
MFIFVIQILQKKMERNLHEITSQWKTYGKRLFSEDLEVRDECLSISPVILHQIDPHAPISYIKPIQMPQAL